MFSCDLCWHKFQLSIQNLDDWYRISKDDLNKINGANQFIKKYGDLYSILKLVYPDYNWESGTQKITGYTASHVVSVQVSIEEKEKLGSVIDAGIGAGAGINYINYELTAENQKKYKIDAIKSATQDATEKAEALAEGAGASLGRLVSISTNEFNYYPWMAYAQEDSGGVVKSGAEIATSITPSEQEISASVTAVFKIR